MNCGMNEFWNGARGVTLVLRNQVHLGAKQLSVLKVGPLCVRGGKTVFELTIFTAELDHG